MQVCILDAGPLIHLDQLASLHLLEQMGTLFCPEIVAREAEFHRPGVLRRASFVNVVEAPAVPSVPVQTNDVLHAGELSALAWAEKFGADVFLSDDVAARTAAEKMGLEVCGTIGVILDAVSNGVLSDAGARGIFQRIRRDSTLHISNALIASALKSLR